MWEKILISVAKVGECSLRRGRLHNFRQTTKESQYKTKRFLSSAKIPFFR